MDRRAFFRWMSLGWLASVLPMAIAACTGQSNQAESQSSDGFQAVGTVADLDKASGSLQAQIGSTPVVVIRNPQQAGKLVALNAVCTHAGCKVNWQKNTNQLVCPCHASEFDSTGKVTRGPATKPLASYTVELRDQTIFVKLS